MRRRWSLSFVLALFLAWGFCFCGGITGGNDGLTLVEIKKSFRNVDDILYDWTGAASSDYCFWRGITCDNITFEVISLNFSGLNLDGEISPAIGNLRSLVTLDLKSNQLSGQIPDEIGDCSLLETLDLSFNNINGDIPYSISKLKKLESLILKSNQLTGPIPSTLSQIPNLKFLDLAQNKLSGEIPRLIYWNEVLQYLGLRGNNLEGSLSPDMCQLTGLWYFDVKNNSLKGTIPESIGNCTSFQVLDLSYNQFSGEIPFNIGFLQVATLSLQNNKFTGSIPSVIGLMQALAVLDLSCNLLSGPIPPILGNLTYTEKLYLQGNRLTGPIPPELGNMTMLHYLELNDNQLTGSIPPELGKLTDLFDLNIANNYLEGTIPDNLSSCVNLNSLNAHGNKLNGTIPRTFKNLDSMTYLNLSANNLKGPIPIELSRIGNLDTLDISSNMISGPIHSSIGDLEHLLKLNLSNNHLFGYLPPEFGNLRSIMEIDLSRNQLSGQIPQEFGLLQNLMLLRVENNNLSGGIMCLTNCPSLSVLNVSYNKFVGDIPNMNNLSRFSPESFIGNPGLCGYWLGSQCDSANPSVRAKQATISKAAILGIALGALVILLLILVAACRPHKPPTFPDYPQKPVTNASPKLVILHMNMALHVYDDIMRMTENLSEKYIIGYGASSTVYKCVLKNCRPVAIKRIYSHYPQYLKEFDTELETLGSIKHRNLVSLQGYSLSPFGNLLFYDYMENGSLWDLLHGSLKKKKLDWETRLKIALGAAEGLAYLHHDCSPRIIHRDVKSSNILLDKDFEAHLTDFGIAKFLCVNKAHTSTYVMGTIGYIDPEYARTSRLNEKSDVYSYGIVLLELLTGKKAVDEECNLHQLILSKAVNDAVMETVEPEISATCSDLGPVKKVFQLALLCTKKQPSDRPTMHEVVRLLNFLAKPNLSSSTKQLLPSPPLPSTMPSYMNGYSGFQKTSALTCTSFSSSDAQLFLKFGEVISHNSE
ncbi:LRR receptor-like serine/threonine-protein kinase ERECTA [Dendrobium catenatum]|nr:LRR receptor-like serine/threonine-protein kinase ERECTA [Dendrobium catenatum]XP_020686200.1 LRR receptor-like serine/threonine-protein kinase ERECTA [Dendrobium catenatum]XP_028557188.1 LRR receptor-like serine/threonine-protein kinase ERECTA [Dendrobium catenatum]XP_028557189.1 LRR receptor-like serine/threonine-protein kinase ERECTA [Dendrobium catenatum]